MITLVVNAVNLIKARPRRNVDLTSDYRIQPSRLCSLIKINDAVHDAVIRQGNARLTHALYFVEHRFYPASAVEQAVFTVNVQMGKRHLFLSVFKLVGEFDYPLKTVIDSRTGYGLVRESAKLLEARLGIVYPKAGDALQIIGQ